MVSCLMGDSTALASAIVRCCLKYFERELMQDFLEISIAAITCIFISEHGISHFAGGSSNDDNVYVLYWSDK